MGQTNKQKSQTKMIICFEGKIYFTPSKCVVLSDEETIANDQLGL